MVYMYGQGVDDNNYYVENNGRIPLYHPNIVGSSNSCVHSANQLDLYPVDMTKQRIEHRPHHIIMITHIHS